MVASIAFNSSSFHAEGILALLETAGIWIFQYNQRQGFRSNKENADLSLKDIGNMINKVVQGWINYYTHYYKSEFYEVFRYINQCLIKWVRRSYKKKNTRSRAEHWLGAVARRDRNLFAHWKFGILPSVGEGAV